jgi:hypothetical protein
LISRSRSESSRYEYPRNVDSSYHVAYCDVRIGVYFLTLAHGSTFSAVLQGTYHLPVSLRERQTETSNTHRDHYSHASGPHTYAHAPCTPHIPFRTALAVPPSTQASDRFLTATNRVHELAATAASAARTDTQASRHAGRPRRTTHSTPANNLHDRSSWVVSVCNVHLPLWGSRLAGKQEQQQRGQRGQG